jgi:hypothetical protein
MTELMWIAFFVNITKGQLYAKFEPEDKSDGWLLMGKPETMEMQQHNVAFVTLGGKKMQIGLEAYKAQEPEARRMWHKLRGFGFKRILDNQFPGLQ